MKKLIYTLTFILLISCLVQQKETKIPVIYITDIYHPYQDPDDHFDLAAIYAVNDFDIKAIVIDYAQSHKTPGRIPIEQMNDITGKKIPYFLGLTKKLKSPDDKALYQDKYQDGCEKIIKVLKNSTKKVIIFSVGSLRDVVAAYNRDTQLFKDKVDKLVVFIGEANKDGFIEYNVRLDPNAYIQLMNNLENVYWVPCFDGGLWQNNGNASFWREHRSVLLKNTPDPFLNFFLYAFSKSTDTVDYINYIYKPVNEKLLHKHIADTTIRLRDLWCCSVFPYFADDEAENYPFTFEDVKIKVDSNLNVNYTSNGNTVKRFVVTDSLNYRNKMTAIFNKLIQR